VSHDLPGKDGMVVLEYVGGNYGIESWYGPVTAQRYQAGLSQPVIYVDARDAPGLLAIIQGRRPVFKVHPPPAKAVPNTAQAAIEITPEEAERVNPGTNSVKTKRTNPVAVQIQPEPEAATAMAPPNRRNDGKLDKGELLELAEVVQATRDDLTTIQGVGKKLASKLYAAGVETVQAVARLTPSALVEIVGGSNDRAIGLIENAKAALDD